MHFPLQLFVKDNWCVRNGQMKRCRKSSRQSKFTVDGRLVCKSCVVSFLTDAMTGEILVGEDRDPGEGA